MHDEYALAACLAYLGAALLVYAGLWVRWGWTRRRAWGSWVKRRGP